MEKKEIYLCVRVMDGKAEVQSISKEAFYNSGWREHFENLCKEGEIEVYFSRAEVEICEGDVVHISPIC